MCRANDLRTDSKRRSAHQIALLNLHRRLGVQTKRPTNPHGQTPVKLADFGVIEQQPSGGAASAYENVLGLAEEQIAAEAKRWVEDIGKQFFKL